MASLIQPLQWNVPIVDPATGRPAPHFITLLQKLAIGAGLSIAPDGSLGIGEGAVTLDMIEDITAQRVLGSIAGGPPEEVSLSQLLDWIGSAAHGDILYRGASSWARLAAGTSGQFLKTNGAGANPEWATGSGGSGGYIYTAPAFSSVSSLLHCNGTNGSTTVTDQVAGNTWTAAGTAAISTAQSVFGGASLLVPGSGNSGISMPTNNKFDVGSGEWTIEFRWRYNGVPQTSARVFQTRNGDIFPGIGLNVDTTSNLLLYLSSTGASFNILNGTAICTLSQSGWNNVLIQKRVIANSGIIDCFVDGRLVTSTAVVTTGLYYNAADSVIIGGNTTGVSRSMNAYIDEFRFTKGSALVTLPYTQQTAAFPDS